VLTYLFDASAAVELYAPRNERTRKTLEFIAEQRRTHRKAVLLIPNFCIVEVFNALAKKYFAEHSLEREGYEKCLKRFRQDIHWGKTLYAYDLNRYHVLAADEIIPIEHSVAVEHERDHLSTFDILVIAMACELAFLRPAEDVYLLTCDRRIKKVCDQLAKTDKKVLLSLKVPGLLDEPQGTRWLPPKVLYLLQTRPSDIPRVERQPAPNF
jgi:predicted nucleic acid-binding protein